jgi:hypothetical protein
LTRDGNIVDLDLVEWIGTLVTACDDALINLPAMTPRPRVVNRLTGMTLAHDDVPTFTARHQVWTAAGLAPGGDFYGVSYCEGAKTVSCGINDGCRMCQIAKREHTSNHIALLCDLQRGVAYQRCFSARCTGGRYPTTGIIPPEGIV